MQRTVASGYLLFALLVLPAFAAEPECVEKFTNVKHGKRPYCYRFDEQRVFAIDDDLEKLDGHCKDMGDGTIQPHLLSIENHHELLLIRRLFNEALRGAEAGVSRRFRVGVIGGAKASSPLYALDGSDTTFIRSALRRFPRFAQMCVYYHANRGLLAEACNGENHLDEQRSHNFIACKYVPKQVMKRDGEGETAEHAPEEGHPPEVEHAEGNSTEAEHIGGQSTEAEHTEGNSTEAKHTEGNSTEAKHTEGNSTEAGATQEQGVTQKGLTGEAHGNGSIGVATKKPGDKRPAPQPPKPDAKGTTSAAPDLPEEHFQEEYDDSKKPGDDETGNAHLEELEMTVWPGENIEEEMKAFTIKAKEDTGGAGDKALGESGAVVEQAGNVETSTKKDAKGSAPDSKKDDKGSATDSKKDEKGSTLDSKKDLKGSGGASTSSAGASGADSESAGGVSAPAATEAPKSKGNRICGFVGAMQVITTLLVFGAVAV